MVSKDKILQQYKIPKKDTVIIGTPPIYDGYFTNKSGSIQVNEAELLKAIPAFFIEPLELDQGKSIVELLTEFTPSLLKPVDNVPSLLIITKNPPVVTYNVSHDLSSSLLESAINFSSNAIELLQAFNLQPMIENLFGGIVDINTAYQNNTNLFHQVLGAIAARMSGYVAMFPKLWRGSDIQQNFRFNASFSSWYYKNPAKEIENVLLAFSNYIFPRSVNPADFKKIEQQQQELISKTESSIASNTTTDQSNNSTPQPKQTEGVKAENKDNKRLSLIHLMFKYPYYCRLYDARTGGILVYAGMINDATIEIDYSNTLLNGVPGIINFEFSVQPIIPLISNGVTSSYEHITTVNWAKNISGNNVPRVESPFKKVIKC